MEFKYIIATAFLLVSVSGFRIFEEKNFNFGHKLIENKEDNPDVGLRVPALVAKYGYPLETYTVKTKDGYILDIHRIPHGVNNTEEKNKPVVFLQHGLLCSSADWILMGPKKGLGYLLADRGYDVWMGNSRGNTYSRKHESLNPDKDDEYWNFSWHEMGTYDLPTVIDFILEKTGQTDLSYVGHSQGTTSFFVMTSMHPEYNDKIKVMIALAPVVFMKHIPNLAFSLIGRFSGALQWVIDMLGAYEFLPSTKFMQLLGQLLCNEESQLKGICSNILFLIAGYDEEQLDPYWVPVILSNTPAGSATKQFIHFGQGIKSDKFQQFDYGAKKNEDIYGSQYPPEYDLKKVSAPVALFYGQNDLLTADKDVDRLYTEIEDAVIKKYKIKYAKFSHLDFLWSIDVVDLLYDDVFDILDRF